MTGRLVGSIATLLVFIGFGASQIALENLPVTRGPYMVLTVAATVLTTLFPHHKPALAAIKAK